MTTLPIPALPPEPFPWPFDTADYRMAMGLRALAPQDWLLPDAGWPGQLRQRRHLLTDRLGEVVAVMPEATGAVAELQTLIVDHLTTRHPALFGLAGAAVTEGLTGATVPLGGSGDGRAALIALGRLVAEDLCLMLPTPGGWRLAGAVLCFPNRWRLQEKLGRPLPGIHRPVPGYDAKLAVPVDRFFDSLAADRMVWRTNWSLNDDAALFQPTETAHTDADRTITLENAGDRLFLRVERQSLRRLPGTGAVVFAIRTHQKALKDLDPGQRGHFADILRSVPPDVARYKGLERTRAPALAALTGTGAFDPIDGPDAG